jgi:hypothetical protein
MIATGFGNNVHHGDTRELNMAYIAAQSIPISTGLVNDISHGDTQELDNGIRRTNHLLINNFHNHTISNLDGLCGSILFQVLDVH